MRLKAKRPPEGSRGRFRLALLAATAAAFLLVPAAQAFGQGELFLTIEGEGSGRVSSSEGGTFNEISKIFIGEPPISCSWNGATGEITVEPCENEPESAEGFDAVDLVAFPAENSEFAGWTVETGEEQQLFGCGAALECLAGEEEGSEPVVFVTATFECAGTPPCPPSDHTLTLEKPGGGEGWVTSEDAEQKINCGLPCTERSAEFSEIEPPVIVNAYGRDFKGWSGCDKEVSFRKCKVDLSEEDRTVQAEFVAKKALTLVKEGGGEGWVTSLDGGTLNCGLSCTERTAYFDSGPVDLRAYGQQFQGWTSCPGTEKEEINGKLRVCEVALTTDEEVKAEFE